MKIRIEWDRRKAKINLIRHGFDFRIVSEFLDEAIVRSARNGRLQAIGRIDGRVVSLVFQGLGSEAVALISLRPASAKERLEL